MPSASLLFTVSAAFILFVGAFLFIRHLEGVIMSEAQSAINAVVAQLNKAKVEILDRVADLEAQIEAAGAAGAVDVSALVAAAQALDDIVPDVVEDPAEVDTVEVPEPVVEGDPVVEGE